MCFRTVFVFLPIQIPDKYRIRKLNIFSLDASNQSLILASLELQHYIAVTGHANA